MKCLCCGKEIPETASEYVKEAQWHSACVRKFFGTKDLPELDISEDTLTRIAEESTNRGFTVPGVQKKMSLHLTTDGGKPRLTLVNYPTGYILKPQTEQFEHLPEVEDLTMHLADIAGIATVPHSLIRFKDGELNYITRRIDRTSDGRKLPMEDICQLSGKLTEQKYQGSHEMITTIIKKYSSAPRLDIVNYWEQVIFSWIVGNADMHLKNFSLIGDGSGTYRSTYGSAYGSTAYGST